MSQPGGVIVHPGAGIETALVPRTRIRAEESQSPVVRMREGATVAELLDALRAIHLSLRVQELAAQAASLNIANAGRRGAQALRFDVAAAQDALSAAASPDAHATSAEIAGKLRDSRAGLGVPEALVREGPIDQDIEVADMVAAATRYQSLTEALGRRLGLMRLAIGGRN